VTRIDTKQRKAGIVLVVVSAVVFSSAGVFTNGVSTDAWGIIFWRGVAAAAFTLIYLVLRGALLGKHTGNPHYFGQI